MALAAGQKTKLQLLKQKQSSGAPLGPIAQAKLQALQAQKQASGIQKGSVFNTAAGSQFAPSGTKYAPPASAPAPDPNAPPPLPSNDTAEGFTTTSNPGAKIPEKTRDVTGTVYEEFGQQFDPAMTDAFKKLDFNALPAAPGTQDLLGERARIEGELKAKYTRGFDEEKARAFDREQQRLMEAGIMPGSGDNYKNAMKGFEDNWNARYDDANARAVSEGGAEWERTFGIGRTGREDALSEQILGRQFPIQQLSGLMGLGANAGGLAAQYAGYKNQRLMQKKSIKAAKELAKLQGNIQLENMLAGIEAQMGDDSDDGGVPFDDQPNPLD